MPTFVTDNWRLLAMLCCGSVLLSAWCLYADPIVNNDGIRYFQAAAQFAEGQWHEGLQTYKWPFYPWLIGTLSQLAGIPVSWAAHLLNAALLTVMVVGFVALVHELGGDRRTLFVAAVLILLVPTVNHYRSFVIRDFGYLAGYLWSLVFLFRYWRTRYWGWIGAWGGCAILATAFRIEALAFLVLLPLFILWQLQRSAAARRLWAGLTVLSGGALFLGFGIWLAGSESGVPPRDLLAAPLDALRLGWQTVASELLEKLRILRQEFGFSTASPALWLTYVSMVILMIMTATVKQIGLVFGAFAAHGLWRRLAFPRQELMVIWWAVVAIHLFVLCEFVFSKLFLPRRYTVALVLTLLAAAPFSITWFYGRWREGRARWFPAVMILCLIVGIRGLDVFSHKEHLRAAGLWLRGNTPPQVRLFSDNQILIYFSGKPAFRPGASYNWQDVVDTVWTRRWQVYDYLAVNVGRHDQKRIRALVQRLQREPLITFENDKGDRVLIFDVRGHRPKPPDS